MIKTIIFDNHGVITTGDLESKTMQKFANFLGVKPNLLDWDYLGMDVDEGKITTMQFYKKLIKEFNPSKNLYDLKKLHLQVFKPKKDVQKFAKNLSKKYEIVLLSNFGDGFDEFNKKWKLEKIFKDKIFISAKLKMRKPNKDIFLYTLKKINKKPKETIFIDDNFYNIKAAEKLGMNAILFNNIKELKKDLRKYINI